MLCVLILNMSGGTYGLKSIPNNKFLRNFSRQFYLHSWCFLFYQKMCTFFKKNAILCLFLKNVSPSKRVMFFFHYCFQTKTYYVHLHSQNYFFNSGKNLLTTLTAIEKAHWTYQENIENITLRNVPSITFYGVFFSTKIYFIKFNFVFVF